MLCVVLCSACARYVCCVRARVALNCFLCVLCSAVLRFVLSVGLCVVLRCVLCCALYVAYFVVLCFVALFSTLSFCVALCVVLRCVALHCVL